MINGNDIKGDINVTIDGLTTVVELKTDDGEFGYGVARCRPDDHFEEEVGEAIATARAFKDLYAARELDALLRSRCEKDYQAEEVHLTLLLPNGKVYERLLPRSVATEIGKFAELIGGNVVDETT